LKIAHEELQKAQQKGKHYYDRKTKVRKFQPGQRAVDKRSRGPRGEE